MHTKFVAVLFVLCLASCKCGLLNWFNEWTDELEGQNADTKCREKRETDENGITAEITNSASDKIVSLMDIEEGKLPGHTEEETQMATQGYSKSKRCPKDGYVGSIRNAISGTSLSKFLDPLPLVKRESEEYSKKMCKICMSQPTCKLFRKCNDCNKYCGNETKTPNDVLPTSRDSQIVGTANRMAKSKNDNIFSKTLYPMSTYREGETKDIICKIVGITDTADIETVTIWVTTFSNNPPKAPSGIDEFSNKDPRRQENLSEQKMRQVEPKEGNEMPQFLPGMHMDDRSSAQPQPQLEPRFNDYDGGEDIPFPKLRNVEENIKENPDLIEGPPPFLKSNDESMVGTPPAALNENGDMREAMTGSANKEIIVQPKEFESDESDENDTLSTSGTNAEQTKEEGGKNNFRPSILKRLRELTTPKATLKSLLKPTESKSNLPGKGGFLQHLLNSDQAIPYKNNVAAAETPTRSTQNGVVGSIDSSTANDVQNAPTGDLGDSNNKFSEINDALQEVKTMVKNMQEEAQKASEKRLLGATHVENAPEDLAKKTADITQSATNSLYPAVPSRVVDNIKEINKYVINRAQDTLDTINHSDNNKEDPHSDMTKKVITNFKKMPQFVLNKIKDTFNELESTSNPNPPSNIESGSGTNENVQLARRFGDNANDTDLPDLNTQNDDTKSKTEDVPSVGSPESPNLNDEIPTIKAYKNKLEKYLAELKERRQKTYSPEKYLEEITTSDDKNSNNESLLNPENPSSAASNLKQKQSKAYDVEKQRSLLRDKLKQYIDDVKFKKISPTPGLAETEESENTRLDSDSNNIPESQLVQLVNQKAISEPKEFQGVSTENPEQVVGEPNLLDELNSNRIDYFLPTIPSAQQNELSQITEKPNRFMKYLEDLRAKKLLISTSKPTLNPLEAKTSRILNTSDSKKDLLKDRVKQYVENLKKPIEERVSPTLSPRIPENLPQSNDLNENLKSPNIFESSIQNPKKYLLKEKLQNYINSLNNPMESRMNNPKDIKKFPMLMRKSSETQKAELNALKKKLDNLLKERVSQKSQFNPIIAEQQPNEENAESAVTSVLNGAEDIDDSRFNKAGEEVGSVHGQPIEQLGAPNALDQLADIQNLQNRNSFPGTDLEDWSKNLGKIVQSSSKPKDVFFIGNGIKLPLHIKHGKDGSVDLSVDIDKLCSCYNSTCPKNHTAIEETVGAILEKEAELQDQLKNPSGGSVDDAPSKSNIFKRSSENIDNNFDVTTLKNTLQTLTRDHNNNLQNKFSLPKLPTFEEVATELADIGKKLQKTFTNSIQKLEDNVEELNKEVTGTLGAPNVNSLNKVYTKQTAATNLKTAIDKNNDVLRKLKHEKDLSELLNKINPVNINQYIKKFEREKALKKLLQQLSSPQTPTASTLKQIENQASNIINNFKKQQLMKDNALNKIEIPKIPGTQNPLILANQLKDNLKTVLPTIPKLQDRVEEINSNLAKMSDAYEYSKINVLKNKLEQLDNEVDKYEEDNEKLFAEESRKFFGGRNNKVVQEEISLFAKALAWLNGLSKSENAS